MGYVTKEELMDSLSSEGQFKSDELAFMKNSLIEDKSLKDTILKLSVINIFEEKGILTRFYSICKEHSYFPLWLDNVEKGIDYVSNENEIIYSLNNEHKGK